MLAYHGLLLVIGSGLALAGLLGARAPDGPFGLYAYGSGIGGAPVFYSQDMAFIGDQTQIGDEEAARVIFTAGPNNSLFSNPADSASKSWANKAFFIPSRTSKSHHVGFTNTDTPEPDADIDTSGFIFYGATALHQGGPDNDLQGLWYAVPTTQSKRVWALQWNATDDDGLAKDDKIAVTLRTVAPARPF
ncbi:hypothetical protein F5Y17DRAFT_458207 [Xylariaceae sp. FL0594]|nr:hypothetical protein F5Y17DRAFT_458207 [Xylariaceae sp. FL0594]